MNLPHHIADMCGIIDKGEPERSVSRETFQAIKQSVQDDCVIISYRDQEIGWISEIKDECRGPRYRALTKAGTINRFYTQSSALDWLLSEMH